MRILILFLLLSAAASAQPVLVSGGKLTSAGTAVNQFLGWNGSEFVPKTVPTFWLDGSGNPADATTDSTDIVTHSGSVFGRRLFGIDFNGLTPNTSIPNMMPIYANGGTIPFSTGNGTYTEFVGMSLIPIINGAKGLWMGGSGTNFSGANGGVELRFVAQKTSGGNYVAPSVNDVIMKIAATTSTGSGVAQTTNAYSQSETFIPLRVQCDRVITGTDNGYSTILGYNGVGANPATNIAGAGQMDALILASDGFIKFPQYSRTAAQDTQTVTQFFGLARYSTDNKIVRKNISGLPNFGNTDLIVGANRIHTITDVVSFRRTAIQSVPTVFIESVENGSNIANLLTLSDQDAGAELDIYHDGTNLATVLDANQSLTVQSAINMTFAPQGNLNLGTISTRTNNTGAQNYGTEVTSPVTATIDTSKPVWYIGNGCSTVNFPPIVASPTTGEAKIGDEITLIINGNTSAVTINPGSSDNFYITNGSGTSASDSNAANNNYFKIFKAISLTSWAVK